MLEVKAENYIKLAKFIARKYYRGDLSYLIDSPEYSDALVGLTQALNAYEANQKYQFSTFAHSCITHELIKGYRRRNKKRTIQLLFQNDFTHLPAKESKDYHLTDVVEALFVDDKDTDNEKKYKKAVWEHYIDGKSYAEIGREMNVSRMTALIYGQKGINLLKERFVELIENTSFEELVAQRMEHV